MTSSNINNALINFLASLDNADIEYVIWKNIHIIEKSINGLFNLDIYIPSVKYKDFLEKAKSYYLIRAIHPVNNFPYVEHFYLLDKNLKIFHLHVYSKIITGESILKEYILPYDELIINNRKKHERYNIWVLNNEINTYIFAIRHILKGNSLLSRVLYSKEIKSYKLEWDSIQNKSKELLMKKPFIDNQFLERSNLFSEKFDLPNILFANKFRVKINRYLRYRNQIEVTYYRYIIYFKLLINKYFIKRKKILSKRALLIAFTGVDGSGKSTMNKVMTNFFKNFLTINSFHIGKPQGKLLDNLYFKLSKNRKYIREKKHKFKKSNSILYSFLAIFLAILRYKLSLRINKKVKSGVLAFVDRWPTNKLGLMDGPRIALKKGSPFYLKTLRDIEAKIYNNFIKADLCIFFVVSKNIALIRNKKRIKRNKETSYQIINRYNKNSKFRPLAQKIINFNNEQNIEINKNKLLKLIWEEISIASLKK